MFPGCAEENAEAPGRGLATYQSALRSCLAIPHATEQFGERYFETLGQFANADERRFPFAPLDPAKIRPVDVGSVRQFLLREAALLSQRAHPPPELNPKVVHSMRLELAPICHHSPDVLLSHGALDAQAAATAAVTSHFQDLFRVPDNRERAKFLARVFGIFSEEIVRLWSASPNAPYENLGRPTIRFDDEPGRSTLDFTLRHRVSGRTYVAELKCEIEYEAFRYFLLTSPEQLNHHTKPAFRSFLRAAREPRAARVTIGRRDISVDGAILVWGAAGQEGSVSVRERYELADVLTVESMIDQLNSWKDSGYTALLATRREWLDQMFTGLSAHS